MEKLLVTLVETDPNTGHAKIRQVALKEGVKVAGLVQVIFTPNEKPNSPYHHPPRGEAVMMTMNQGGRRIFYWDDNCEMHFDAPQGSIVFFDDQESEIGVPTRRGHRSEKTGDLIQTNVFFARELLGRFVEL